MGNQIKNKQIENDFHLDDFSDIHNTCKHFQTKSNYAVLKTAHFPKFQKKSLKNSTKQQKQAPKKTTAIVEQQAQSKLYLTSISVDSQQESQQQKEYSENQSKHKLKKLNTINFTEFIEFKTTKVTKNYNFHGRIDGGSFGDVYKASLRTNNQEQRAPDYRAIKMIPQSKANQSVIKQIYMLRKLDHPNILKIYEVYRYNQMYYIVTEYLPGGNLMQLVSNGQKYSEYFIACIMKELMGGLIYLHSNNIIHRDIKPQNIVFQSKPRQRPNAKVVQKGKDKVAHTKLIDFGTSVIKQQDKLVSGTVGTPYFIAPQVMIGCYDQKCDIWSCGVMLYFLLCGSLPYNGSNSNEIFSNILYKQPSFAQKQWANISKSAVALIKNMLNKDRQQRFSAKQVMQSEWMKNRKTQEISFNDQTLRNLRTHGFQDSFTAVVKTYIASMTTSVAQRRLIAEKFMELDKDKSGFIDRQQLVEAFNKQGIPCPNIDQIMEKADINKSGKIDFTEFLTVMTNQQTLFAKQRLTQAFQFLDSDHTGYIEMEELRQVLKNQSHQEVKNILQSFDKNGDNKISKEEFISNMLEYSGDPSAKKQFMKSKKQNKINKQMNISKRQGFNTKQNNPVDNFQKNTQKIRNSAYI